MCQGDCLVPVWRFPSPFRSIHFGDVSRRTRLDHGTRNALAARNNKAWGLKKKSICILNELSDTH